MEFKKYMHIERFGVDEVLDIELWEVYIFPKIDWTNWSVWIKDWEIYAWSRNRELTLEQDNAWFYNYVSNNDNIKKYLEKYPNHRLYWEWLVPHSLHTYRDDTWKKFYIFDVESDDEMLPYNIYKELLDEFELDYIPPLSIIKNASYEDFDKVINKNTFLIKDNSWVWEWIVIKNYDYYNKFWNQIWAKIVTNEFKDAHRREMGSKVEYWTLLEEKILNEYCTKDFIDKECAKFINEKWSWNKKDIPWLFEKIFNELIKEEMLHIILDYNYPRINFKTLKSLCMKKIKEDRKDLFI